MPHQLPHYQPPSIGTAKLSNLSGSPQKQSKSWTEFDFSVKTAGVIYCGTLQLSAPVTPDDATVAAVHKAEHMANVMDYPFDHANLFVELLPHV